MKSIILARVSTEDQKEAGNSLPAQIKRLEDYCKRKDLEVIKKFSFDESAYKSKRDEFDRILEYLKKNKEKIAVCFDKVDRFSRNVFDKRVSALYEMSTKDKIELHFASDNLIINSEISATEKFHFGMSLGLAKYYSDAISDNVKRARERQLENGQWPHHAPIGYRNVDELDGSKNIVPDESRAHLIVWAFEAYATGGKSLETILKELKTKGLVSPLSHKPLVLSHLDKILKNPFYYGQMIVKGQVYRHKYQPLISKDLFDKCEEIRAGRTKTKYKYAGRPSSFRGLIKCEYCGCSITSDTKIKKSGKSYTYHFCTQFKGKCGSERVTDKIIDDQIVEAFKAIQIPQDVAEKVCSDLEKTVENEQRFYKKSTDDLNRFIEESNQKLKTMYQDRLVGRITPDDYDKYVIEEKDKQLDWNAQLKEHIKADKTFLLTVSYIMELANRASELYQSSKAEEKRQLIAFALSNLRLKGKKLLYDYKKPFNAMALCHKTNCWQGHEESNPDPRFWRPLY